jgi:superfamily I DNA/RNA helicase
MMIRNPPRSLPTGGSIAVVSALPSLSRNVRQSQDRWYSEGNFGRELNPLETDVILLATFRAGRDLLADRRIAREVRDGRYADLVTVQSLYRTQVLVDEATDFSPIQLSCMACLCDAAMDSLVACGDFNQRITEWGSRSNEDLRWVFSDFDLHSVSITYRHSRQLNDLARNIALLSSPDVPEAQLPQRVNNDGFDPVLAKGLAAPIDIAAWLGDRIAEIERLTDALPPIAVLVADEAEVLPMTAALNSVLAGSNILVVPCPFGQLAGQDNDVRVFDVRHIKGLEFEAVFFTGIDRLAERQPDLFEKYLYVGATRAAMYLGLTTRAASLPAKIASLENRFKERWP